MGSANSKPRKGKKKQTKHLPKVGTPENLEWEHKGYKRDVFGGSGLRFALVVLVIVCAVLGLIAITI
jgi:hypothetical protein